MYVKNEKLESKHNLNEIDIDIDWKANNNDRYLRVSKNPAKKR